MKERKNTTLNQLKPLAGLLWILCPALGASCGYFGSKALSIARMLDVSQIVKDPNIPEEAYSEWYDSYLSVTFASEHTQADLIGRYTMIAVALGIVAIAGIIGLMILTGRFDRDENGKPALNWFDKIWTEVHIVLGTAAGAGAVLIFVPLFEMWPAVKGQGYTPNFQSDYYFGISNNIVIVLVLAGSYFCLLACMLCLVTLVKKLKAGTFLKGSLVGIILIQIEIVFIVVVIVISFFHLSELFLSVDRHGFDLAGLRRSDALFFIVLLPLLLVGLRFRWTLLGRNGLF